MGTEKRRPGKPVAIHLTESVSQGGPLRVDRDRGVIHHVKILGFQSPNRHGQPGVTGTEYSRSAVEQALPLYEGRQVFTDHPSRANPKVERSIRDLVGVIRNPVVESDGVYGDLHYPPSSPLGCQVADFAEHMPEALGLSHNADGFGVARQGKYLIESIPVVRSVDIVTRPATTKNLCESRETTMPTLKELLESRKFTDKKLVSILEDDMGMPMDAPPPEPVADSGWRDHLKNAVSAIISDETLDEGAVKKKINQILAMMKDEAAAEPPVDDADDETTDEPALESKDLQELKQLRTEKAVRTLCESLDFHPSGVQIKALCGLDESDRKAFVAEAKKAATVAKAANGPRSNSLRSLTESRETNGNKRLDGIKDGKSVADFLLGRN